MKVPHLRKIRLLAGLLFWAVSGSCPVLAAAATGTTISSGTHDPAPVTPAGSAQATRTLVTPAGSAQATRTLVTPAGSAQATRTPAVTAPPATSSIESETFVHLRGVAMATQRSKLGFTQPGRIVLLPKEGDVVRKGQVVARIDDSTARVTLVRSEATLANGQLALEQAIHSRDKNARLKSANIVSDMAVAESEYAVRQARSQIKLAEADREAARLAIEGCKLVMPYDGVVVALASHLGEYVGVGATVLELADLTNLELTMDVPPELVKTLQPGTKTQVMEPAGRVVGTAQVRSVMPFIDGASGLRRVIWSLTPGPGEILAGRYLTLKHWGSVP
ncbi:MAG: efflux RND transporter periplasmic adaptor subunit [Magnetococcales bacterium]|nr:efflux RND transporter periplasmic adaptor subunit [Magnetococcales bacterium]